MPDGNQKNLPITVAQARMPVPFVKRVGIAAKAASTIIGNITPESWMSALQPLIPFAPIVSDRQFDYPVGYNINYTSQGREAGRTSYNQLRSMAVCCETLRLVIETRKDQICSLPWRITPKDEDQADVENPKIDEITSFLQKPDKIHEWEEWLRAILEELFVTDTVSLYKRPTKGQGLYALDLMDGTTIFVLIDDKGRRPTGPNDPAYQQILKGVPKANYTAQELIYRPRNIRVYSPYGYSPTEQVVISAQMEIQRSKYQLSYFTAGSTPDTFMEMGEEIPADQIEAFEARFNSLLSGNPENRWQVPFLPKGSKPGQLKAPPLKDEFDEWIARKICMAFSISPTPFMKQMNKGEIDGEQDRSLQEGLSPLKKWIKDLIDPIIQEQLGAPELEFSWVDLKDVDAKTQMEIDTGYAGSAIMTINEVRHALGKPPVDGGDRLMVKTPTGYVPLDAFEQQQEQARIAAQALQYNPSNRAQKEEDGGNDGGDGNQLGNGDAKAEKVRKAGGLKPLPFPRANTTQAVRLLAAKITPILKSAGKQIASQIRNGALKKLRKDDADDIIAMLDMSALDELVTATPPELKKILQETGQHVMAQLGTEHRRDLVNQVNQRAVEDARARAAEMIGKKWVDGELVDNPNAEWRIDTGTREEIRSIIADGLEENIGTDAIADLIEEAGAFSPERAQLIAETEIARASSQGSHNAMEEAVDAGVKVKKSWFVDEDPCPICQGNAADGPIELDESFSSGDDMPPAHPNCECALQPVVIDEE